MQFSVTFQERFSRAQNEAKQRIHLEIERSVDQLFDLILEEMATNKKTQGMSDILAFPDLQNILADKEMSTSESSVEWILKRIDKPDALPKTNITDTHQTAGKSINSTKKCTITSSDADEKTSKCKALPHPVPAIKKANIKVKSETEISGLAVSKPPIIYLSDDDDSEEGEIVVSVKPGEQKKKETKSEASSSTAAVELSPVKPEPTFFETVYIWCTVPLCLKTFANQSLLNKHLIEEHGQNAIRCYLAGCLMDFKDRLDLDVHRIISHSQVQNWKCAFCSYAFNESAQLAKHVFYHHQRGRFQCIAENCRIWTIYRKDILTHYFTYHPNERKPSRADTIVNVIKKSLIADEPPYNSVNTSKYTISFLKCIISSCTDFFISNEQLSLHLAEVHRLFPIICPAPGCHKSFGNIGLLSRHFNLGHPTVTLWRCEKCDKVLLKPNKLYQHQVDDHYEGLFKCAVEGCKFNGKFRGLVVEHYRKEHQDGQAKK